MDQQVEVIAAEAGGLSSVPKTCIVESKNGLLQSSFNLHMCAMTYAHYYTHTKINVIKIFK